MTDTIFALATAPGRAAIAVLRLSGPSSAEAVKRLAGELPEPRHAALRRLRDAEGRMLDEALVLWLPGPGSYTGEDGAELHLHGGPAVVDATSQALIGLGLRLAEPGEFTRRAFEHGRLDLSQAEAIADLVDAETQGQRRQAVEQLDGALSRRHEAWRGALIEALALLEAAIDFPDEDLPADVAARVEPFLLRLEAELGEALADADRGERVREGFRVAIIGAPNAGKSSLLNRLLGRDAAIVTGTPGTTRDVIEAPLVLGGYKLLLADTAGVREAAEDIEAEGVRRARRWAEDAELRLLVMDASATADVWLDAAELLKPGDLVVANKVDRPGGQDRAHAEDFAKRLGADVVETVASTGEGVDALRERLADMAVARLSGREFPAATRARHRTRLSEALEYVRRAISAAPSSPELAAEDVRLAGRALGRISGRIDPEEVLERIFASFCIGK
jgi:tRNA modification GTPase